MILYKQYVEHKPGEFQLHGQVGLNQIFSHINSFEWDQQLEEHYKLKEAHGIPGIILEKDKTELRIFRELDSSFSLIFRQKGILKTSETAAKPFTEEELESILNDFYKKEKNDFLKILNEKEHVWRSPFIRELFISNKKIIKDRPVRGNEEFVYKMLWKKVFKKFTFSFVFLIIPIMFELFYNNFDWDNYIILQTLLSIPAIPAIIITINNYLHNKELRLFIRSMENKFIVLHGSNKYLFDKEKIIEIIAIESSSNGPWSMYGYFIIHFEGGEELWLSNLLISIEEMGTHFAYVTWSHERKIVPLMGKSYVKN